MSASYEERVAVVAGGFGEVLGQALEKETARIEKRHTQPAYGGSVPCTRRPTALESLYAPSTHIPISSPSFSASPRLWPLDILPLGPRGRRPREGNRAGRRLFHTKPGYTDMAKMRERGQLDKNYSVTPQCIAITNRSAHCRTQYWLGIIIRGLYCTRTHFPGSFISGDKV